MNTKISFLPDRAKKTRNTGLTMMMDKGLGYPDAVSFTEASSEFTDLVKFGFGTAVFAKQVKEKIALYKKADIEPYFGGTLFEAYIVRGLFEEYKSFVSEMGITTVEVSDGSIRLNHDEKLGYISELSKDFRVLSEVGSKVKGVEISNADWVSMMSSELEAGAWKVIAEARESGTIGIYKSDGSADQDLINEIVKKVNKDDILWEAPNKAQQVYFINLMGSNVNLGNIASGEVTALEALRLGLRGDTFFNYLPEQYHDKKP